MQRHLQIDKKNTYTWSTNCGDELYQDEFYALKETNVEVTLPSLTIRDDSGQVVYNYNGYRFRTIIETPEFCQNQSCGTLDNYYSNLKVTK